MKAEIYVQATTNAINSRLQRLGKNYESLAEAGIIIPEPFNKQTIGEIRFIFMNELYDQLLTFMQTNEVDFIKEVNFEYLKLKLAQG